MTDLATQDYSNLLESITQHINQSQQDAAKALNHVLLVRNHKIGQEIIKRRTEEGWGAGVVRNIAKDLAKLELKGFGYANLQDMALFAEVYSEEEIVHPRVDNLSWTFHQRLLRVKDKSTREWYLQTSVENKWSRKQLEQAIKESLHEKKGKALSNFELVLETEYSKQAQAVLQSNYNFSELGFTANEKEVEDGLVSRIGQTIQKLGHGFAFVEQQYGFNEGGQEFRIDLLFYHTKLHCYVVFELKDEEFKPEHAGKLNFYVSSIDDIERGEVDNPTIGVLLCREYNDIIVERTLRGQTAPIAVSDYVTGAKEIIQNSLPKELANGIPKDF